MQQPNDDPVLRSARREALVVLVVWLVAMGYVVGYCAMHGYDRTEADLKFVLGFPDWIFWGIVVPWTICVFFSFYFGATFMRDEDLGADSGDDAGAEGADHD